MAPHHLTNNFLQRFKELGEYLKTADVKLEHLESQMYVFAKRSESSKLQHCNTVAESSKLSPFSFFRHPPAKASCLLSPFSLYVGVDCHLLKLICHQTALESIMFDVTLLCLYFGNICLHSIAFTHLLPINFCFMLPVFSQPVCGCWLSSLDFIRSDGHPSDFKIHSLSPFSLCVVFDKQPSTVLIQTHIFHLVIIHSSFLRPLLRHPSAKSSPLSPLMHYGPDQPRIQT